MAEYFCAWRRSIPQKNLGQRDPSSMCTLSYENKFMNLSRDVSVIDDECERVITSLFHFSRQQTKDELCEVVQDMESHGADNKHSSKEKQMSIGRKKFNMDPKKGKESLRLFGTVAGFIQLPAGT